MCGAVSLFSIAACLFIMPARMQLLFVLAWYKFLFLVEWHPVFAIFMHVWIDLNNFSPFSSPATSHYRTLIAFKWAQSHDSILGALTWALLELCGRRLTSDRLTGLLRSCQLLASVLHLRTQLADTVWQQHSWHVPSCYLTSLHFEGLRMTASRGLTKALLRISMRD